MQQQTGRPAAAAARGNSSVRSKLVIADLAGGGLVLDHCGRLTHLHAAADMQRQQREATAASEASWSSPILLVEASCSTTADGSRTCG
jgi:hypothetical protein